jgi:AcrR family transcriptional regulator
MARPRSVPDPVILHAVRSLLAGDGSKGASFADVARLTGLAPSTLVQRYGSVPGMAAEALRDGWAALQSDTTRIIEATAGRGAQTLLKSLAAETEPGLLLLLLHHVADEALRDRALAWRALVEAELSRRIAADAGGPVGDRARDSAAMLFALWQGGLLWEATGAPRGYRLKDALRRLSPG